MSAKMGHLDREENSRVSASPMNARFFLCAGYRSSYYGEIHKEETIDECKIGFLFSFTCVCVFYGDIRRKKEYEK